MLTACASTGELFHCFRGIVEPRLQALLLLLLGDVEIVFAQGDAVAHQHPLERHDADEEFLDLLLGGKAHHALDAGAVVPGAVEDHELVGARQEGREALEIPLRLLAVGGLARRVHAGVARAHMLDQPLDRAVLAGAVAALDDDEDAGVLLQEVPLQLDELDLQGAKLAAVVAFVDLRHRRFSLPEIRRAMPREGKPSAQQCVGMARGGGHIRPCGSWSKRHAAAPPQHIPLAWKNNSAADAPRTAGARPLSCAAAPSRLSAACNPGNLPCDPLLPCSRSCSPVPRPLAASPDDILAANRAATGAAPGKAAVAMQFSYAGNGLTGTAGGTSDLADGRFEQDFDIGPQKGANGFDGTQVWNKDNAGIVTLQEAGDSIPARDQHRLSQRQSLVAPRSRRRRDHRGSAEDRWRQHL